MNTYKVLVSREEYGYITIEAESEEQAMELVNSGEYSEDMYVAKNGGIIAEKVEQL